MYRVKSEKGCYANKNDSSSRRPFRAYFGALLSDTSHPKFSKGLPEISSLYTSHFYDLTPDGKRR